jgi:uncharacterized MAPEG superfamily protein
MGAPDSQSINQLIQTYSICTLFLFCKYIFAMYYAVNFNKRLPEDKVVLGGLEKTEAEKTQSDEEIQKRKERTFLNDVENIPFHVAIFWAALLVEILAISSKEGDKECLALLCLIVIYTSMRTLFTICFIFALQPYRSIVYAIASLSVLATLCITVACAFKLDASKIIFFK